MVNSERRRDVRAYASPIAHLMRVGGAERVEVANASFRGLFFRCQRGVAPPLNQLIKIRVELPTRKVVLHAIPVRVVPDAQGRAGVGVRFFALNGEEKIIWDTYVVSLLGHGRRMAA